MGPLVEMSKKGQDGRASKGEAEDNGADVKSLADSLTLPSVPENRSYLKNRNYVAIVVQLPVVVWRLYVGKGETYMSTSNVIEESIFILSGRATMRLGLG